MELSSFKAMNKVHETSSYVSALEAFDAIPQLVELKELGRERGGVTTGASVLDVGCGFGLETLRLAQRVGPSGHISGVDVSPEFIEEARARADRAGLAITFQVGDARDLPFADDSFDCVRAERMLIYLKDFEAAVLQMRRVTKPGGRIALIEPDFSTNTINIADRALMRRIVDHEVAQAVEQSWLPGPLFSALHDLGFQDVEVASRVLVFPQELAASYFGSLGTHARQAGVITDAEQRTWQGAIDKHRQSGDIFATIGYFLFTAICP